ncbi:hypothetical protein D3H55_12615 [Bacillus salacetis]|uniref:Uncharacterized protein n=1 Tax=Bacillus salacetis TaxID=2315464 RepID=A0A3A1QWT3_9BACI|nr:hypothetical protein D3H55_12615 [Bacillus salacetis]
MKTCPGLPGGSLLRLRAWLLFIKAGMTNRGSYNTKIREMAQVFSWLLHKAETGENLSAWCLVTHPYN